MENRWFFKAKRKDDGEWVFGGLSYCEKTNAYFITNMGKDHVSYIGFHQEVDSNTICQCTGLKDKNGRVIWENDIVRDKHGNFYKAFWQNNYYQFSWICAKSDVFLIGSKWDLWSFKSFEIEVIGNIFDNPELLESEE